MLVVVVVYKPYLEFPVEHVIPVESFKPPVTFDIVGSVLNHKGNVIHTSMCHVPMNSSTHFHVAEAFGAVLNEELFDEIFGDRVHVSRPVDLAGQDFLVDAERVVVEKRRIAGQHFVNEYACDVK